MYSVWLSTEVMQFTAATASSGCLLKAPMPRSMPPSAGALSVPESTWGKRAQPMSSNTALSSDPSSTALRAAP